MKAANLASIMVVRILGIVQILMGAMFWIGAGERLVPIHMLIGLVFVLAVWVIAILAARAGVPIGSVAGLAILGLVVLVFGLYHKNILPDPAVHWLIQVVHLALGIGAMGFSEALAAKVHRAGATSVRA